MHVQLYIYMDIPMLSNSLILTDIATVVVPVHHLLPSNMST
jgi:hypothetical protein